MKTRWYAQKDSETAEVSYGISSDTSSRVRHECILPRNIQRYREWISSRTLSLEEKLETYVWRNSRQWV